MVALLEKLTEPADRAGQNWFPFLVETDFAGTAMEKGDGLICRQFGAEFEEWLRGFYSVRIVGGGGHLAAAVPSEGRRWESALRAGDDVPFGCRQHDVDLAIKADFGALKFASEEGAGFLLLHGRSELKCSRVDQQTKGSATRHPAANGVLQFGRDP